MGSLRNEEPKTKIGGITLRFKKGSRRMRRVAKTEEKKTESLPLPSSESQRCFTTFRIIREIRFQPRTTTNGKTGIYYVVSKMGNKGTTFFTLFLFIS
ncbi:hypothetical protein J1N35_008960 [Gossypium stocksii]|uniref:Uncharacterized protein n=1 Tax=Gossypium stocksii TaxID=47602 RepID=A0A9D3W9U3_9ROSI|nr:hypothetical protein J1N35_008960 [Gossypium stocksii]